MNFKKIAAVAAASALVASATVAQAGAASQLSLNAFDRASTESEGNEAVAPIVPIVGGIIAGLVILEVTEAIDIFSDDDPESP